MNWSVQQRKAIDAAAKWYRGKTSQVFKLFGYAGTGKTTIARHIADSLGVNTVFGAYTGKAAHVLRQKGCRNASTIHKLIYVPKSASKGYVDALRMRLEKTEDPDEIKKINLELERCKKPGFKLNHMGLWGVDLIIIDECSMLDKQIGEDLLSFNKPILVLGDPAQLPPIKGHGFFDGNPDIQLTDIHRQAADNPIIHMATKVRNGEQLRTGNYGESTVINCRPAPEVVMCYNQILTGKNQTRKSCNKRVRSLLGIEDVMPVENDRLVCLRNDHEIGILNGQQWTVKEIHDIDENNFGQPEGIFMTVESPEELLCVDAHTHYFQGREDELAWWDKKERQEFDYGYALTCHKAQGSQWDDVLIFDESHIFRKDARRWMYTALTRAANKVMVVL